MEGNFRSCELTICNNYSKNNGNYTKFVAIDQEERIIQAAHELNKFGKQFLLDIASSVEEYYSAGDAYSSEYQSVINTVDTVVLWVEHSGRNVVKNLKKKEAVLRGVLRLTELGKQASIFGMLELACQFLDVPENPYPAEREYIAGSLAEVDEKKRTIFGILRDAGDVLRRIIDDETFDISKGEQFDYNIKTAELEIQICERRLDGAKEIMVQLMQKMRLVKLFSRAVRFVGIAITWYFVYDKYQDSTISLAITFLGLFLSALLWLSFFPGNAYAFYEALSKLNAQQRLLSEGLDEIRERLKSVADHKDEFVDKLSSSNN